MFPDILSSTYPCRACGVRTENIRNLANSGYEKIIYVLHKQPAIV